jgi:hypothetical protein
MPFEAPALRISRQQSYKLGIRPTDQANIRACAEKQLPFYSEVRKLFITSVKMGTFVNNYCCFCYPLMAWFSGPTQTSAFPLSYLCSWAGIFIFIRKFSVKIS